MKKGSFRLFLLSAAMLLFVSVLCLGAVANDGERLTENGFAYTVNDGEATLVDIAESVAGEVNIPATLGGYPLTRIAAMALNGVGIVRVTVPEGVKRLEEMAFYFCADLSEVSLPNSLESIGEFCFDGTQLQAREENWIGGILYADGYAVETRIYEQTTVTLAEGTRGLADLLIRSPEVERIVLPEGVRFIGKEAFQGCVSLKHITLPHSLVRIGESAFASSAIESAYIAGGVTEIAAGAFDNCTSLVSLTVAHGVKTVGEGAFRGCASLTGVSLPASVTEIGDYAFEGCHSIGTLTLGGGLSGVGVAAFADCGISEVRYLGTAEDWEKIEFAWQNSDPAMYAGVTFCGFAKGDVNMDGAVDAKDEAALRAYLVKGGAMSEDAFGYADVNADGEITSRDVVAMLQKIYAAG